MRTTLTKMCIRDRLTHDEKHYALDEVRNNGLLIRTDKSKNVVEVYYALDENEDGTRCV